MTLLREIKDVHSNGLPRYRLKHGLHCSAGPPEEGDDSEDQKQHEQHFGDPRGGTGYAGKTKEGRNDSDDQEDQSVMQHGGVPLDPTASCRGPQSMCHSACCAGVKVAAFSAEKAAETVKPARWD
jgi:hypothetical protein